MRLVCELRFVSLNRVFFERLPKVVLMSFQTSSLFVTLSQSSFWICYFRSALFNKSNFWVISKFNFYAFEKSSRYTLDFLFCDCSENGCLNAFDYGAVIPDIFCAIWVGFLSFQSVSYFQLSTLAASCWRFCECSFSLSFSFWRCLELLPILIIFNANSREPVSSGIISW